MSMDDSRGLAPTRNQVYSPGAGRHRASAGAGSSSRGQAISEEADVCVDEAEVLANALFWVRHAASLPSLSLPNSPSFGGDC